MTFRVPTAADLKGMAAANFFELSEQELADFEALIPDLFANYEVLENLPLPPAPLKHRDREPGYRPSRQDYVSRSWQILKR